MKKLFTLFFCCVAFFGYAQTTIQKNDTLRKSIWEKYTDPSLDNFFSNHFKQYLSQELILTADLSKRKKVISVSFNLDKKNNIIDVSTNSENEILNNAIINAFKLISLDELKIPVKSELHNYSLQIITKENDIPIIKCSSLVLYTLNPVINSCKKNNTYKSSQKCINTTIATYITNNFDINIVKKSGETGTIKIFAIFEINKDTKKIDNMKVKAPNEVIEFETKRVLYYFPEVDEPGYMMGDKVSMKYSLPIKMVVK
ncbi:hypothetical protein EC396_06105 [Lutibacter sp. HS1-25]|uniref:hypothetical protein n=1 Tax=Lutibacter sp. HS1-25 TaxID=2485000 RepID=UPI00101014F7|nr:hypothetical protein [Lutibacter sp. HS1-25]RXP58631.1 hypothetical protein EC396_06105 [Lutibacter sp. HS1-25]